MSNWSTTTTGIPCPSTGGPVHFTNWPSSRNRQILSSTQMIYSTFNGVLQLFGHKDREQEFRDFAGIIKMDHILQEGAPEDIQELLDHLAKQKNSVVEFNFSLRDGIKIHETYRNMENNTALITAAQQINTFMMDTLTEDQKQSFLEELPNIYRSNDPVENFQKWAENQGLKIENPSVGEILWNAIMFRETPLTPIQQAQSAMKIFDNYKRFVIGLNDRHPRTNDSSQARTNSNEPQSPKISTYKALTELQRLIDTAHFPASKQVEVQTRINKIMNPTDVNPQIRNTNLNKLNVAMTIINNYNQQSTLDLPDHIKEEINYQIFNLCLESEITISQDEQTVSLDEESTNKLDQLNIATQLIQNINKLEPPLTANELTTLHNELLNIATGVGFEIKEENGKQRIFTKDGKEILIGSRPIVELNGKKYVALSQSNDITYLHEYQGSANVKNGDTIPCIQIGNRILNPKCNPVPTEHNASRNSMTVYRVSNNQVFARTFDLNDNNCEKSNHWTWFKSCVSSYGEERRLNSQREQEILRFYRDNQVSPVPQPTVRTNSSVSTRLAQNAENLPHDSLSPQPRNPNSATR